MRVTYTRATSLFDIDSNSKVFFIQPAENETYEIIFGDNVSGRAPKDNSVISVEYRISNGQLPNGCKTFKPDTSIDGESGILITTNSPAASGSVSETIDEIKYNAPRHFTTQERAVTTEDYENLLKQNFPEINAVSAYGGEDLNPPQFGKVFVAVDLVELDGLPDSKKDEYYKFLKPRSPVSIDPEFVNPDYIYIELNSIINYNINITKLTTEDIRTIVTSAVRQYAITNLDNFNRVFRYSKVSSAIDDSQQAIISNETTVKLIKNYVPTIGIKNTFDVPFLTPLDTSAAASTGGFTIQSTNFRIRGESVSFQDDGEGRINIIAPRGLVLESVGTVDYDTGLVQISDVQIDSYEGAAIRIKAVPLNRDIKVTNNVILNIIDEDINLSVRGVSQ